MATKCAKCIEYFKGQKKHLELIRDLKAKNEGLTHAFLKTQACSMIRELFQTSGFPVSVETEVPVKDIGKVDVLAHIDEATIAVECGSTNPKKILALKKRFDIVLHIPYCYTWDFFNIDFDKLTHHTFVALVAKGLDKKYRKDLKVFHPICLEQGECSLPSGKAGFPEEAEQIALQD